MKLTAREKEILRHACLSYETISNKLNITKSTVRTHFENIRNKYPNSENRQGCLIEALQEGEIYLEEVVVE